MGESEISVSEEKQKSHVCPRDRRKAPQRVGCKMAPSFPQFFCSNEIPQIHLPSGTVNYFSIYLVDLQVESNLLPGTCLTPMLSRRHSNAVRLTSAPAQLLSHRPVKLAPSRPWIQGGVLPFSAKGSWFLKVNKRTPVILCWALLPYPCK